MNNNKIINFRNSNLNKIKFNKKYKKHKLSKNDNTNYSKIIVRKPWGYEYLIYQNKEVAVWILNIFPNQETSMHCHPLKDTSLLVLKGEVICGNLNESYKRKNGDAVFIEKKVFHKTSNKSKKTSIIMEIESPNNKKDLLRIQDRYGRELKGYEKKSSFSINTNNYNYISLDSKEIYHNITKKFGDSSVSFIEINSLAAFKKLIRENYNKMTLISILYGYIKVNEKKYNLAETIDSEYIHNDLKNISISNRLSILITKQNDNIVKFSDLIFNIFENQNINKAFVVAGDSNLHLLDSVGKKENFNLEIFDNEYLASFAALGYSKFTHNPPILLVSAGSSSLRVIEAVTNAYIDSDPIIIISGQTTTELINSQKTRQIASKSIDIVKLIKSVTKYSVTVTKSSYLKYHLEKAIHLSRKPRSGPVWIDLPIDLLGKTLKEKNLKNFEVSEFANNTESKDILSYTKKIQNLLLSSKQPIILIGYGVRLSKSEREILELIDHLKIPVVSSRRGADLIKEHNKYFYGRPGVYGNRYSNIIIQKCDLLICFGSRLSIPLIGRRKFDFARNAKKILIDVDKNELNKKTINIDLSINYSCDLIINSLLRSKIKTKKFSNWINKCNFIKKSFSFSKENYKHNKYINPYLFIKYLSKKIPKHSIIFMDGGPIMNYLMQSFEIKENQRIINNSGLDNDGFSFLASIGLDNINTFKYIVVLCDINNFLDSLKTIEQIIKKNLPYKIFFFEGAKNIAFKNSQDDYFGSRYVGTNFYENSKIKIYKKLDNFNFKIKKIKSEKDYINKLKYTFSRDNLEIFSIKLDNDHKIYPKTGFSVDYNGNWEPKPLEDMYPFISSSKLQKIMQY